MDADLDTPLPCDASRETVKSSDPSGDAGYGYCASHSRYFWGFRLYARKSKTTSERIGLEVGNVAGV